MTRARLSLGQRGEGLAADKLSRLGYKIVAHNFRCPSGEIDLVTRRGDLWVFVEVRTRRGEGFGTPEQSITVRKKRRLVAAAQTYLQEHDLTDVDWRIDVVAVGLSAKGELLRVEVIENAVNEQ